MPKDKFSQGGTNKVNGSLVSKAFYSEIPEATATSATSAIFITSTTSATSAIAEVLDNSTRMLEDFSLLQT